MKKIHIYKHVSENNSSKNVFPHMTLLTYSLQKCMSNKRVKRISIILLSTCFISFMFVVSSFTFIKTHQEFAANFADNTLRPMIGDRATITIESLFFGIEDHINQIKYETAAHTILPTTTNYTIAATVGIANAPKFSLEPIKPIITDNAIMDEGQW